MKRNIKTNLATLEKEFAQNEANIKKLQKRNEAISAVFNSVEKLTGTGAALPKVNANVGRLSPKGRPAELLKLIDRFTEKMHVREIAFHYYGHDPSQEETDIVANICSTLYRAAKVLRPERGYYQSKTTQKTTAKIGDDTRVTQVQPKLVETAEKAMGGGQ